MFIENSYFAVIITVMPQGLLYLHIVGHVCQYLLFWVLSGPWIQRGVWEYSVVALEYSEYSLWNPQALHASKYLKNGGGCLDGWRKKKLNWKNLDGGYNPTLICLSTMHSRFFPDTLTFPPRRYSEPCKMYRYMVGKANFILLFGYFGRVLIFYLVKLFHFVLCSSIHFSQNLIVYDLGCPIGKVIRLV